MTADRPSPVHARIDDERVLMCGLLFWRPMFGVAADLLGVQAAADGRVLGDAWDAVAREHAGRAELEGGLAGFGAGDSHADFEQLRILGDVGGRERKLLVEDADVAVGRAAGGTGDHAGNEGFYVIIVVAGMEGALPSVIGGLVLSACPL